MFNLYEEDFNWSRKVRIKLHYLDILQPTYFIKCNLSNIYKEIFYIHL